MNSPMNLHLSAPASTNIFARHLLLRVSLPAAFPLLDVPVHLLIRKTACTMFPDTERDFDLSINSRLKAITEACWFPPILLLLDSVQVIINTSSSWILFLFLGDEMNRIKKIHHHSIKFQNLRMTWKNSFNNGIFFKNRDKSWKHAGLYSYGFFLPLLSRFVGNVGGYTKKKLVQTDDDRPRRGVKILYRHDQRSMSENRFTMVKVYVVN